tara:strand:- start:3041 stop:4879 length:1839 start_codon:yes stop_codon:yes gene_type:complete
MYILGISAFYHDSAACIIKNNEIIAAAQEERFTREKHDSGFPFQSIEFCIKAAKIQPEEINNIVFYEKPFLKFERLLETYLAFAPKGFKSFVKSMPIWIKEKLFQKAIIVKNLQNIFGKNIDWKKRLYFSEHHLSHAASAFYPSPFKNAAILSIDGVGEWATTSIAVGKEEKIEMLEEINFPHSLGLLYSAFTYFLGFKVNSGEYKVMGLAPYGQPKYAKVIKNKLIKIFEDGSFQLNMDYFEFTTGLKMTNSKFNKLFSASPRNKETEINSFHMDIAASIQSVTEEIIVKIAKHIKKTTNQKNLCLAGGVALNCVANGVLLKEKIFDHLWIQPASGDAGGALGAALSTFYLYEKNKNTRIYNEDTMKGCFLGPEFSDAEIEKSLNKLNANYRKVSDDDLIKVVIEALENSKAVGWMQGKMEFGPRALGARSIIADPRSPNMQKNLNLKIKYRESFRPFAPSVLYEYVNDWFELDQESPYMLLVSKINKNKRLVSDNKKRNNLTLDFINQPRSDVPAITHVDFSARVQTVHNKTNRVYYKLLKEFYKKTGCPILVNTSFNIRGEPIVCSPEDAYNCFMGTELDVLTIGNFLLIKKEQKNKFDTTYKEKYELD